MREGALPGATPDEVAAFGRRLESFGGALSAFDALLAETSERVSLLEVAFARSAATGELAAELHALREELRDLEVARSGEKSKSELSAPQPPTIGERYQVAVTGNVYSTYGPTPTHRRSLELAEAGLAELKPRLARLHDEKLPALEAKLRAAGAPWTPGQPLP